MAINPSDALEIKAAGLALTDDDGNQTFYLTSGAVDPTGSAAPVNTWYIWNSGSSQLLYYKYGSGNNDWRQIRALDMSFDPSSAVTLTQTNVQDAIIANDGAADTALQTPRFTLLLQHNGTVGNGTFYGYSNLLPGDATPVLVPVKSELIEFSFSNASANADYTLEFRINSISATPFYTVSKVNEQSFTDQNISQTFNVGDAVYVKHIDDGGNASDVGIVLFFKAVP